MECLHEDRDGLRIIRLKGRMDIPGNEQIAMHFNSLTVSGGSAIIVDLSDVDFLSSIGIGTLVMGAKTVKQRQGMLVLFGARSHVLTALERTSIPLIIPTYATMEEARARATSPAES